MIRKSHSFAPRGIEADRTGYGENDWGGEIFGNVVCGERSHHQGCWTAAA